MCTSGAALLQWIRTLFAAAAVAWACVPCGAQTEPLVPLPAVLQAAISGNPATPQFVTEQIDATIGHAFAGQLPPGSVARAVAIMPAPQALAAGFATSFSVSVVIDSGAASQAYPRLVRVDVENVDVAPFDPQTLAFRDDPERITTDGVLSRTVVRAGHPARLYYYHQNVGTPRRLYVVLSANGSVRTTIHTIAAAAGPNVDVMSVGHAVSRTFLDREPRNEGTLVNLAGGKPLLERATLVGPGEGVVGSFDARVVYGGPLTVTVMAIPPAADPATYLYTAQLPADGHGRHGDFELADFGQRAIAYTAGGPAAVYRYGRRGTTPRNLDPSNSGHDFGDYGVLWRIAFDLANPLDTPVEVYLYERPLGGVVRSTFIVDKTLVELGCVRVAQPYEIRRSVLEPRSATTLDVLSMTDGGSNYPIEIGVTTVPPLGSTPPISAPDGCFPKHPASP